jgi:hypothetical protein
MSDEAHACCEHEQARDLEEQRMAQQVAHKFGFPASVPKLMADVGVPRLQ